VSLRALIEAKQRRTATWPLLVGNPSAAAAEVKNSSEALAAHQRVLALKKEAGKRATKAETQREQQLRDDLKAALERVNATVVRVELQALPDHEWEGLFADLEPDASGDLDLDPILAPLLAASCTDPELQDVEWWSDQLKQPAWTDGDKAALSRLFLELNAFAPQFDALGKG